MTNLDPCDVKAAVKLKLLKKRRRLKLRLKADAIWRR